MPGAPVRPLVTAVPPGELTVPATACRAGISYCIGGSYGACIGEVRPTPESCNGIDDDCNGAIDDGLGNISCGVGACKNTVAACVSGLPNTCTPLPGSVGETCGDSIDNNCNGIVDEGCGCTYVSPLGNDSTGTGAASLPFLTISKAITAAGTNGLPLQVCVGGTATCAGTPATATYTESVQMRDGVSVLGGYSPVGATSWVRANGCTTAIQAVDTDGLVFGHNVTTPTTLDGFVVNGFASGVNAAILVDGSTGAIIQNVTVNGGAGTDSAGIIVQRGGGTRATPLIRDAAINGGTGSSTAIGVSVVDSAPTLSRNCSTFDGAGRCTSWGCFNATRFVRGRTSGNGTAGSKTYAVNLQDGAGTVIDTSALCSFDGQGDVAGLHITGSSAGILIRQNQIVAPGGMTANVNGVGVWMEACGGASPWIVDNSVIAGQSRTLGGRADGIRAVGDCHPRIDRNQRIVGGEESANNDAIGVYCARDPNSSVSSRCTILDNVAIQGSSAGFPPTATGVRCDAGACARLERNGISGNRGVNTFGVVLNGASTFVDRNVIEAGCTTGAGVGLLSIDAPARVQNNVIRGASSCTPTGGTLRSPTSTDAARVQIGRALTEIDLHSNTLLAVGGSGVACVGRALAFEVLGAATPGGPRGVVRNNILHAGVCATTFGLVGGRRHRGSAHPREQRHLVFDAADRPLPRRRNDRSHRHRRSQRARRHHRRGEHLERPSLHRRDELSHHRRLSLSQHRNRIRRRGLRLGERPATARRHFRHRRRRVSPVASHVHRPHPQRADRWPGSRSLPPQSKAGDNQDHEKVGSLFVRACHRLRPRRCR